MLVEEGRLFFCTARGKDFYAELLANSAVAVTGLNDKWQTVRLMGRAERLADAEQHTMIDRIFEENPSMNEVYPGETRYILEAFVIAEGSIEFFDLGKSPICRESLALGKAPVTEKGFFITEACIGCGTCASLCPQQCIEDGGSLSAQFPIKREIREETKEIGARFCTFCMGKCRIDACG
ncbi:4Fe-4S binding protein [Selenomonas noxia]|uniref:4Fe-4S binding protein n=1 Tax=Selenomonas noxia TaxID=135083 RepID=UPI0028E84E58|nr:4Fe-4S binding protein [Selenomonas noxia]